MKSERVKSQNHDSVIREKIILVCLIDNPFLIFKYAEELGKIRFNDLNLASLISEILEFSVSKRDKDLENFNLKSYLSQRGLDKEITYIYQDKLLNTYSAIIENTRENVEKSFIGLIDLQKNLLEENDLDDALSNLEEKMDEESFENFIKIKKESLNKN